jgi:hypothetical protein
MSITEKIAVRRDAVARAPYALLEVINAAISLGELKAGEKESGMDHALLAQQHEKFADAQHAAVETLAVVCKEADAFRAMSQRPQTIIQALNAVAERIQKDNTVSASAADKAASGDPEYTKHKDACADLSNMKDSSEYEMRVAETNLKAALATLEAFTALQRSGESITEVDTKVITDQVVSDLRDRAARQPGSSLAALEVQKS